LKNQPNRDYNSNDRVMTPPELCERIVNHFQPRGMVLEPFRGTGIFYHALGRQPGTTLRWCEIDEGRDFFEYSMRCDWIVSNPPFSQFKSVLKHSFELAENVVFLVTLNHALGLKARLRLCDEYGFGIREVLLVDTPPKPWPQSGFQVGAVHWQKGYQGDVKITDKRTK